MKKFSEIDCSYPNKVSGHFDHHYLVCDIFKFEAEAIKNEDKMVSIFAVGDNFTTRGV